MNSLGDAILSTECGWMSLSSSTHPAICRNTVWASSGTRGIAAGMFEALNRVPPIRQAVRLHLGGPVLSRVQVGPCVDVG